MILKELGSDHALGISDVDAWEGDSEPGMVILGDERVQNAELLNHQALWIRQHRVGHPELNTEFPQRFGLVIAEGDERCTRRFNLLETILQLDQLRATRRSPNSRPEEDHDKWPMAPTGVHINIVAPLIDSDDIRQSCTDRWSGRKVPSRIGTGTYSWLEWPHETEVISPSLPVGSLRSTRLKLHLRNLPICRGQPKTEHHWLSLVARYSTLVVGSWASWRWRWR